MEEEKLVASQIMMRSKMVFVVMYVKEVFILILFHCDTSHFLVKHRICSKILLFTAICVYHINIHKQPFTINVFSKSFFFRERKLHFSVNEKIKKILGLIMEIQSWTYKLFCSITIVLNGYQCKKYDLIHRKIIN